MQTLQSFIAASTLAFCFSLGVQAADSHADYDHSTPEGMSKHQELLQKDAQQASTANDAMVNVEVRKVDQSSGKLTLRHEPIPNLGMGAMTMVYRVADPAMLDKLKVGDKIRFQADSVNGALTVTKIE